MRSLFLLSMILAPAIASAQQLTILHNATLIDGTGSPAREHVDIAIRNGLIESVARTIPSAGATVVDCTGKTIIPGLISAHSHVGILLNNADPSATAYTTENVTAALNQYERYGVTTILSLGLNRDLGYDLRAQQRSNTLGGATLFTAGRGIGVPDGAPPLLVAADQIYRPATESEARQNVDELAVRHADIVKIWVDPLHGKVPSMDPAIYAAIIDQSHLKRLHVAAHVYLLSDARQLVQDGIDVLAHSVRDQTVDSAFIQSMLQHHTWYIPTLALDEAFFLYATHPEIMQSNFFRQAAGPQLLARFQAPDYATKTLAAPQTAQSQRDSAIARQNLKALYDSGVQIAFGTDSGAVPGRIPGFSEHRELENLVAAGFTPLQAITIATGQTGQLLHTLDPTLCLGLIVPGYSADLIILTADPLTDIKNTRRISAVYHRGHAVPNPAPQD
ncbi:MAG TPA: amidohydrolase family protein [Edaphobacter sp.]|jgi:imidazolonepropionase-like amidohydrolase|nr:amidohydrolase family protein [Edaphobacter sp.]